MKNKIKTGLAPIIFLFWAFGAKLSSAVELLPAECRENGDCGLCEFIEMFINAADIIAGLSASFAILMFIFGGFYWITAYGDESKIKKGKDTLIAAVTGILVVFLAWTLVNIIIAALFGGEGAFNWYQGPCSQ